jgi:hypothetical protein
MINFLINLPNASFIASSVRNKVSISSDSSDSDNNNNNNNNNNRNTPVHFKI